MASLPANPQSLARLCMCRGGLGPRTLMELTHTRCESQVWFLELLWYSSRSYAGPVVGYMVKLTLTHSTAARPFQVLVPLLPYTDALSSFL